MEDLQVVTSTGAHGQLAGAAIVEFKTSMRGPVLCVGDEGYEEARQVWNGLIDRHPALIARCSGVADVIDAVNFARTHNLLVSVRGGGHNVAGSAVCDGGLMIDLSLMKGIHVDPKGRTVRAQGGVTWGDLRPRDAGIWLGGSGRRRLHHRHRRLDARWRPGLAAQQIWPLLR